MKIHCGLMTMNEMPDLVANINLVLAYVDSVTVIDGGSQDLTIPYMRNWARIEPKIRFFINPWRDNFPAQRNAYISRIREIASDGDWVLAFDPDEFLEMSALQRLRDLPSMIGGDFNRVGFQCRSVSMRGPQRVWQNTDQYWKGLFYRWNNNLHYTHDGEGAVHERLNADPTWFTGQHGDTALIYEHIKQENCVWIRGVRNMFCGGGGMNMGSQNPRWIELKQITGNLGVATWHQMYAYLLAGNIDHSLKDWIIRHRREEGFDGASEHREWFKSYYRLLHPEEEPGEYQHEVIP